MVFGSVYRFGYELWAKHLTPKESKVTAVSEKILWESSISLLIILESVAPS